MSNTTDTSDARLLTLDEVREHLRISRPTLSRIIRSGGLPVVEVRARTFVTAKDLDDFVATQRVVRGR